ncbi:hypothetical protein NHX12_013673 [Muraenolepis orangiensis]|uniref:RNA methyltransferase n=1 Tax=Muraenolepis orangiensis TaxID=630683 RepID=A0A9Q0I4J0_9TELE|nr:hypothetical protein NHX12_013673 [Muraenolepis orangiensis]
MIKMSVDKEVMTVLQSDQLRPPRTHPLHPKNAIQSAPHPLPTASSQRIGKRRYSLGAGFKGLAKRRRRANSDSQSEPVLPSNFLLGGNIFDPLNLNSLLDEEVNRSTNQETPKSSPLPSRGGDPVEILVPHQEENQEPPPHRRRGNTALSSNRGVSVSPLPCELNTSINCRDDVVTPLATPLVGGAKPGASRCGGPPGVEQPPQKKTKHRYRHGGHSRYYGYHGFYGDQWEGRVGAEEDPRLRLLKADWFRERRVLDIGCGSGHVTLAIARRFGPAHILGLDRDHRLIAAATHNIRHFLSHDLALAARKETRRGGQETSFPLSFRVTRGPLAPPPLLLPHATGFPSNVTFITGDYVSRQETWPGRGQYDVILCLGVTKWVQLQSGDEGVERLFRRAFQSLTPGGLFILEPQPWSSYSRKTTETTYQNYKTLRLRPEDYSMYIFHKGPSHRK